MKARSATSTRLYPEVHGCAVRDLHPLDAVSASGDAEDARRHSFGADSDLSFSKLARLAPNTRELLDFADNFRENDATLISPQESLRRSRLHASRRDRDLLSLHFRTDSRKISAITELVWHRAEEARTVRESAIAYRICMHQAEKYPATPKRMR